MGLMLINGTFRVLGAQPDGDSLRFYPDDPVIWERVSGHRVRTNKKGGAQLRLDGIDALETHYNPPGPHLGNLHQPLEVGLEASDALLAQVGFARVERDNLTVIDTQPEQVDGHIFTRFADKYGRPVAFAFAGRHEEESGTNLFVRVEQMKRSANYRLLEQGLVYPTFYSKLFVDFRKAMGKASRVAREAKRGVWAKDVTHTGFRPKKVAELESKAYLMPKLWRRFVNYVEVNLGDLDLADFLPWLEQEDDRVVILPDGQTTGFDFTLEVDQGRLKMKQDIELEELIFLEK